MSHIRPSQRQLEALVTQYQAGRFSDAIKLATSLTVEFPDHEIGWKVLGAALKQTGRIEESLVAKKKSVELAPEDAEAHNSLGITLQDLGKLIDAEASFRHAIALKPNLAEAHNNLGITLQEARRLDEAAIAYKHAIKLKPDFAEAYCNLGAVLQALGKLDEAEWGYWKAFELNPRVPSLMEGYASLLQFHTPSYTLNNPLVAVQDKLQEIITSRDITETIPDETLIDLVNQLLKGTEQLTPLKERTQIFRYNSISLNCERHMAIFDEFSVIPEFCFGCYKIEVSPRSVLELMKLYLIFDQITLPANNIRKCMVELRPEFEGFYKGLVYCSNRQEAFETAELISAAIFERMKVELPILVKRGCSEFSLVYPDYKHVDESEQESFRYIQAWKTSEIEFDSRISSPPPVSNETLPGVNLMDVLIIRNWLAYAETIGDPTAGRFVQNAQTNISTREIARQRLQKHRFRAI